MQDKIYETEIRILVLSQGQYELETLEGLIYDITEGECIGRTEVARSTQLSRKDAVEACYEYDSDPKFFGLEGD